jgi:hypothetical protein
MANTPSNIIVGAAEIAVGTGTPTAAGIDATWTAIKTAVGVGKDYRGWVNNPTTVNGVAFSDVGLTQEGVEVQYQPDFGEVEVDQLLDAARLFKQKMTVQVATTLAEATLENLVVVWDDAQAPVGTTEKSVYLKPGTLGDAPVERHLLFVGPAPGAVAAKQRIYLVSRAVSMEASSHALRRNEATVFPVTFRLLPDTASSFSAYGKIVDITG